MIEKEKERTCENCKDEPATILCSECPKCYCGGCSETIHKKDPNKDHKTERIPKGVDVKATCPIHNGTPLNMLCLDEVKLCCPMCVVENLHKGHKVVKIEDIEQNNEIFSAAEVRKSFTDTLERSTTLNEKIDEVTEIINKEMEETKKKIEIFFDEEHQKLKDEEKKLINELEEACNKAIDQLNDFKAIIENANEYSTVLSKTANTLKLNDSDNDKKECSRLMELNIASEMKDVSRKIEKLLGTKMRDLKISWDREARELLFTRDLFNGAPSVMNVTAKAVSWGEMDVSWEIDSEERNDDDDVRYTVEMRKEGEKDWKEAKSGLTDQKCKVRGLMENSVYEFRVRCVAKGGSLMGEWSSVVRGRTQKAPEFSECAWKECPDNVDNNRKYSVDRGNPRVATKIKECIHNFDNCTIIGNTYIPLNTVTSWSIKMLKSENNNGGLIYIGIAPNDINQNDYDNYNFDKCGWYFYCYDSSLNSGPPHSYWDKEYGPRKERGEYVHTGDRVGVVMDTTKGELSFILNGVNLGVAYEGIPLDKPLVPCVIFMYEGGSVELDTSEVKKNEVDSSISVPSNIKTKSATCDSITLTWDEVEGASFYQIEVDGSNSWDATTTNTFTKRGLLPETEHGFRVRTVRGSLVGEWSGVVRGRTLKIPIPHSIIAKSTAWDSITLTWDKVVGVTSYQIEVDGNKSLNATTSNTFTKRGLLPETEYSFRVRAVRESSVSKWSSVVKGRTLKAPEFSECVWKKCPDYVDKGRKYSVDGGNPRVAIRVNNSGGWCTIIGSIAIPLNTVTSWNIKVLKSKNNDGGLIYIGIAPSDINQNDDRNYYECGWYFDCGDSSLCSGPPHNYKWKEYGPRKGRYARTRDSVGVVVDTTRGDLSFVLNGVNRGVAYEGIPLDKPLVPCVLLIKKGDSIELDTSEVEENVDSSIPVPSNIASKSITWDTITLTWDEVADASFYQIEVDGSKSWDATTNTFTKRGLLPETEHSFRVRTAKENSVSEWSGVVKERTLRAPKFSECVWEECPDDVNDNRKYSVYEKNPRVATKVNEGMLGSYCTIIGNTHIPLDKVTSWSIDILKSNRNGHGIFIGIAPFDINQNNDDNYYNCGWYFNCHNSSLNSGSPHNHRNKEYGPRKGFGQYVHTGDSVGVVVDTTRGDLSFVLDGVNRGVAYEGIPLDKPLVPCVILSWRGDFVELII